MTRRFAPDWVARLYGVTKQTVIGWCEDGTMPAINVARASARRKRWRMSEDDMEEFNRRRANGSEAAAKANSPRRTISRPKKDYFAQNGGAK